ARGPGLCSVRPAAVPGTGRITEASGACEYHLAGRDDRRFSSLFFHYPDFVSRRHAADFCSSLVEAASRRDDLACKNPTSLLYFVSRQFSKENSSLTKGEANSKIRVCLYRERCD